MRDLSLDELNAAIGVASKIDQLVTNTLAPLERGMKLGGFTREAKELVWNEVSRRADFMRQQAIAERDGANPSAAAAAPQQPGAPSTNPEIHR